jgi:hypothetical protein
MCWRVFEPAERAADSRGESQKEKQQQQQEQGQEYSRVCRLRFASRKMTAFSCVLERRYEFLQLRDEEPRKIP